VRIGAYEADFAYMRDGQLTVEDCKSPATACNPLYVWKKAHFQAEYGIKVIEIYARRR
jgi:hypothetical protein